MNRRAFQSRSRIQSLSRSAWSKGAQVSVLLLAASACYRLTPEEGRRVEVVTQANLAVAQPVDVAIAPIVDVSQEGRALPSDELRRAFQLALLERRYSPLALDYVDAAVPMEASYVPGAVREDATMIVTVERWDTSQWPAHDALGVTIEVVLVDPDAPLGAELWKARVDRRYDRAVFGPTITSLSEPMRIRAACEKIAQDLLAVMPARTATPGR